MPTNNILVIKLRYIGDVLLSTPVLTALRERFPAARLTMAVNRGTEDMVKHNSSLNEVLVVERSGIGSQLGVLHQIRQRRFDCVIDLTDGDRSAFLTWFSRAPIRIGFNDEHRWRGRFYTTIVHARSAVVHRVERDLAALIPLGFEAKAGQVVLHTSKEDDDVADRLLLELGVMRTEGALVKPLVMFHPGARYWFKAWPAERFAALADRLSETYGCQILVGGTVQDRELTDAIVKQSSFKPISIAGRVSLLQFASLIKRCRLFIGNDSGAMHIAAAMGTPVVGLFGPSNPAEWGPRGGPAQVVYKGLDCRQCFHPTCLRGEENCMRQITVDEVVAIAERLISVQVTTHVHG
jgi:heptosyltransferase III